MLLAIAITNCLMVNAQTVSVQSYGCTDTDATACIQKAIDSGADKVIVPYTGKTYFVKPIFTTQNNQEIIFEPGVILEAKKGEFKGQRDCLFNITNVKNITLIGYGATFRMQKTDYQNTALYPHSEWRHALNIDAKVGMPVENIVVKGLRLEKSGGDGILVGGISGYPSNLPIKPINVLLQDIICSDNHRQGISVTGAENLRIVNAVLIDTKGTPPQAGIDWEPDWNRLAEVSMQNCYIQNNTVSGLEMYLFRPAWKGPSDIKLTFDNCHVDSDNDKQGLALNIRHNNDSEGAMGTITFNDCSFRNKTNYSTLYIADKSALKAKVIFNRCFFEQTKANGKLIELETSEATLKNNITFGGIDFNDCIANDRFDRNAITFADNNGSGKGIRDINGKILVNNPYGGRASWGAVSQNIGLTITQNKSTPPDVSISSPSFLQRFESGQSYKFSANAFDTDIGTANGSGIEKVKFTIRKGDVEVAVSEDLSAPYEMTGTMTAWENGIYTLKAEAISKELKTMNLKVTAFEVMSKPVITNTENQNLLSKFLMYPNPANDKVTITNAPLGSEIKLLDLNGRELISQKATSENTELNVQALPQGLYMIKVGNVIQKLTVE